MATKEEKERRIEALRSEKDGKIMDRKDVAYYLDCNPNLVSTFKQNGLLKCVELNKRNWYTTKEDVLECYDKRNRQKRILQNVSTTENEISLNLYQSKALETAFYPQDYPIPYLALALVGEAGEVADKIKKVLRDKNGIFDEESRNEIIKECGDVLWYLSVLAKELGYDLEKVATINIEKINSRMIRGLICGSGDNR